MEPFLSLFPYFFSTPIFRVYGLSIPVSQSPRDLYVCVFFNLFFLVLQFSVYLAVPPRYLCSTFSFFPFFSPPIFRVTGLVIPEIVFNLANAALGAVGVASGLNIAASGPDVTCSLNIAAFYLRLLGIGWLLAEILQLSIGTRCLSGGFWPKYYGFQSALGAFGVASGLTITIFNPH